MLLSEQSAGRLSLLACKATQYCTSTAPASSNLLLLKQAVPHQQGTRHSDSSLARDESSPDAGRCGAVTLLSLCCHSAVTLLSGIVEKRRADRQFEHLGPTLCEALDGK